MFRTLIQFKRPILQFNIPNRFHSSQNTPKNNPTGSTESWKKFIGLVPAYEKEIKWAAELLDKKGEEVTAEKIDQVIQDKKRQQIEKMEEKLRRNPYEY